MKKIVSSKSQLRENVRSLENETYRLRSERDMAQKELSEAKKSADYMEKSANHANGYIRGMQDTLAAFGHVIPTKDIGYR